MNRKEKYEMEEKQTNSDTHTLILEKLQFQSYPLILHPLELVSSKLINCFMALKAIEKKMFIS